MSENYKFETDIIPKIGITGDASKIYNSRAEQPGDLLLINTLLTIIETRQGMIKEFPSIGLAQEFAKLSYINISDLEQQLMYLQEKIIDQLGHDSVELTYEITSPPNAPHKDFVIKLTLDNLPGAIIIDVPKTNNYNSIAISTKYVK